jgi:uncharacterized membrane protein YdbT with pleckstrin-like domain
MELAFIALLAIGSTFGLGISPLFSIGYALILLPLIGIIRDILIWTSLKYVVTNLRVIQVAGIFNKNVTDSSLEKVNDIKMDQTFLGRIFNFGDIEILTASELGVNQFKQIGNPIRFKTTLLNAKNILDKGTIGSNHAVSPSSDIPGMIEKLGELKEKGLLTNEEFNQKKKELLDKMSS